MTMDEDAVTCLGDEAEALRSSGVPDAVGRFRPHIRRLRRVGGQDDLSLAVRVTLDLDLDGVCPDAVLDAVAGLSGPRGPAILGWMLGPGDGCAIIHVRPVQEAQDEAAEAMRDEERIRLALDDAKHLLAYDVEPSTLAQAKAIGTYRTLLQGIAGRLAAVLGETP